MPECKHYKICRRDAEENTEESLCILHSRDPKDYGAFVQALADHRKKNGCNFRFFVFPGLTDFSEQTFDTEANFSDATFTVSANFSNATFTKGANFFSAKFKKTVEANFTYAKFKDGAHFTNTKFYHGARFTGVEFTGLVDFSDGEFAKQADFSTAKFNGPVGFCEATFREAKFESARFTKEADFFRATFTARANFFRARFAEGADFSDASFAQGADFSHSKFLGITLFVPWKPEGKYPSSVFSDVEVDFRDVIIAPLDALIFRDADLQKCQFLGADLRKAEFTAVKWPEKCGHLRVYDQDEAEQKGEEEKWSHIEQLYRQLKQNYEDRRDYERAGDFHYGEKEMRRRNSRGWLWILLTAYRWVSGYGESCLLPIIWAGIVFLFCTIGYLWWGLLPKDGSPALALTSPWDWLRGFHYSFQVMTLLKPDDLVPIGFAKAVRTFETLAGPILIGLFALALRQRLKR